jgi:AcrR family transcriptional regulator
MARRNSSGGAAEVLAADEAIPEWKRQSVDRSLQAARVRAQARTDRFVAAAMELMHDQGGIDFTVQEVVERSRMSIRTFYNFFASKDDLMVAVHETILAKNVVPFLRERCDAEPDAGKRIHAYIDAFYELTEDLGPAARAITNHHYRLVETRPDDLERAVQPQLDLVLELVEAAADDGRLHKGLDPVKTAQLFYDTVLAAIHARILWSEHRIPVTADDLWEFCASGLGLEPGPKRTTRARK